MAWGRQPRAGRPKQVVGEVAGIRSSSKLPGGGLLLGSALHLAGQDAGAAVCIKQQTPWASDRTGV